MLYTREITDPVEIQFIILFTLYNADAPLVYSDMLNIILENCNIPFMDFQVSLYNLAQTGHVHKEMETEVIEVFEITDKGRNLSDLFHSKVPVYIREPILDALKEFYKEKRRRDAVRAEIKAVSLHDYSAECSLYDYDKTCLLRLNVFAGSKADARLMTEGFKANYIEIYSEILRLITNPPPKEDNTPPDDLFLRLRHTGRSVPEMAKEALDGKKDTDSSDENDKSAEDIKTADEPENTDSANSGDREGNGETDK